MFERLRLKRAARGYARKLPRQLARDYGPSEFYTEAQIRRSVDRAALSAKFVAIGLAAYLHEEAFDALSSTMPIAIDYDEARLLFLSFLPTGISSGTGTPVDSVGVDGGGGDHS